MQTIYYAHRRPTPSGEDVFNDINRSPRTTKMYGDGEIFTVSVREAVEGEESPYWGWHGADEDFYLMIYPHRSLFRICFPYGPEAEEARGRGRIVNLVVEEVLPETT